MPSRTPKHTSDLLSTTDYLGLLAAIRSNPDDDTARLATADWLEERDSPRAKLIRLQYAVPPDPKAIAQEIKILKRTYRFNHVEYDRGFASKIHGTGLEIWNDIKRGALDIEPITVMRIELPNHPDVLKHPGMRHIKSLFLNVAGDCPNTLRYDASAMIHNHTMALYDSPYIGNIEELTLRTGSIDDTLHQIRMMAHWLRFPSLKKIAFIEEGFNTDGCIAKPYDCCAAFTQRLIERTRECIAANERIPFPNLIELSSNCLTDKNRQQFAEYLRLREEAYAKGLCVVEEHELNPPLPLSEKRRR